MSRYSSLTHVSVVFHCLCGASTEKAARMFSCVLSFSSQQLAVDAIFIISVAIFIISVTIFVAIFFYQLLLLLLLGSMGALLDYASQITPFKSNTMLRAVIAH